MAWQMDPGRPPGIAATSGCGARIARAKPNCSSASAARLGLTPDSGPPRSSERGTRSRPAPETKPALERLYRYLLL